MPKTPPTIVAPEPDDHRVMALAKTVSLTRREAFAAAAEVWAWMARRAVDNIVPQTALDSADFVVDIKGFGQAMLQAGLVGVVNDGLVLPAELRRRERDQRGNRKTAAAEDQDDKVERERKQARARQRRRRRDMALEKTNAKTTSPSPTAVTTVKWTPRRLGTVDGHDVMLLYSTKTAAWFYCLKDASPKEWTASLADQQNPSFAEALAGLHGTMKRETGKGFCSGDTFRPSLQAMVTAAERYRQEREETAAAAARRDEGNKALAEASVEDQDDIDHGLAERDCHAPVTLEGRDTVTVTLLSRSNSVTCPPNSSGDGDLENVTCHAPVTEPAPSSSSSSVFLGNHEKKNTTTTSSVTPHERDHEDGILDRMLGAGQAPRDEDPATAERRRKRQQMVERFAAALGATAEAIDVQWRAKPHVLRARLESAGIDTTTGFPFNAEASSAPAAALDDIGVTTEPFADDKPAAGIVEAPGDDIGFQETSEALDRLGIPRAVNEAPPHDDAEPFEDLRRRTVERLLEQEA
jgi:hypothetical protein